MPEGPVVELELPAHPSYLVVARLLVTAAATMDPLLGDDRLDDLRLAVSEACANAMEAQSAQDTIVLRCSLQDDRVQVLVLDRGRGFDPDDLDAHPSPNDPARLAFERGLGIPLIRFLTDEVQFVSSPVGTAVAMTRLATPVRE
ncbi:anti-sigma B factor RsbW [soil metagenome]